MRERYILGLIEKIVVLGNNGEKEELMARIDSGAITSSIDLNLAKKLELGPVIRSKIVKSASGTSERPIIESEIKINGNLIKNEFTLANRSHMTYPILIGQNILKQGKFLIDPLKKVNKWKLL